jgi:hypothetical protein
VRSLSPTDPNGTATSTAVGVFAARKAWRSESAGPQDDLDGVRRRKAVWASECKGPALGALAVRAAAMVAITTAPVRPSCVTRGRGTSTIKQLDA